MRLKRKGTNRWLVFPLIVAVFISCHSEEPVTPSSASLVDGNWQRPCQPIGGAEQSQSIELQFLYGKKFQRREHYYFDSDCRQPAFQLTYEGRYELTVTWEAYEYLLDFWVEAGRIEGLSPAWVAQANAGLYCGKGDWELGLKDTSGLRETACPLQFLSDNYQKSLIAVTRDRLVFAAPFTPGIATDVDIDDERLDLLFVKKDD
ncbi:MAG: hypothetical protein ACOH5I_08205 [Oligoflexus sp.]